MSLLSSSVGLVSGLNISSIVQAMVSAQQTVITQLQNQETGIKTHETALNTLSANLLTLSSPVAQLADPTAFQQFTATSSAPTQLSATATTGAAPGNYQFQTLRVASTEQLISQGFANTNQQTLGAGTVTLASGGWLATDTPLDTLNGGAGVQRGVIHITDRTGASANVDLSNATTVTDVINAINQSGLAVNARADGNHFVVSDTSGQTTANLTISDINGGQTAKDLGINQSVASGTLTGSSVYQATGAFTLASINDGNQVHFNGNLPDIAIQLTDPAATKIDVQLSGSATLNDVVNKINSATGNAGKVTASIANGRLVLTDNTGGGGSNPLAVTDINGSSVVHQLGLDTTASGNTLTGAPLVAGMNTVLLRNLRGGQGITQPGQVTLTDRTGASATIDLSNATSVNDVIDAINSATTTGGVKLQLTAALNSAGDGLQITDTSGSTSSPLVIADVGSGTTAANLGIAVNAAQSSVSSGNLDLQFVNEATSLATYAPGGQAVQPGSFTITDSKGGKYTVTLANNAQTIGDVLSEINAVTGSNVTAQLNSTGDGFQLVDNAGGTGTLQVTAVNGGATAADLRLTGAPITVGGKSVIDSRNATIVSVAATDTLSSLVTKLNATGAGFSASIVNDGSTFAPNRLLISANKSGSAGRILVDDGGLGLGVAEQSQGQDALLRVGGSTSNPFLLTSSTNHFSSVMPGLSVDVSNIGTTPAQVQVAQNTSNIATYLQSFVTSYNSFVTQTAAQTSYNTTTQVHGVLENDPVTTQAQSTLTNAIVSNTYGPAGNAVNSLQQLGVTLNNDGTLAFDPTSLNALLQSNPTAVQNFFQDSKTGFATQLKTTLTSFTDPNTGHVNTETNSLQSSITSITSQIATLNSVLTARTQQLTTQFYNTETVLANLQSQQLALQQLQSIALGYLSNPSTAPAASRPASSSAASTPTSTSSGTPGG